MRSRCWGKQHWVWPPLQDYYRTPHPGVRQGAWLEVWPSPWQQPAAVSSKRQRDRRWAAVAAAVVVGLVVFAAAGPQGGTAGSCSSWWRPQLTVEAERERHWQLVHSPQLERRSGRWLWVWEVCRELPGKWQPEQVLQWLEQLQRHSLDSELHSQPFLARRRSRTHSCTAGPYSERWEKEF